MAIVKTALSYGDILYKVLTEDADFSAITRRVFPIATLSDAALPYAFYNLTGMTQTITSRGPATTLDVELTLCAAMPDKASEMAEAANSALDGATVIMPDGRVMRTCHLINASTAYVDGAYTYTLNYQIRI